MRLHIDTLDYTPAVLTHGPITITRTLNQPTRATARLILHHHPMPARRARVTITSDDGEELFTGYLATEPISEYMGEASTGPVFGARLSAISDEPSLNPLDITQLPAAIHELSDADGTLALNELSLAHVRELSNDVTVTGAEEPTAYVQELFVGDGTTAAFTLREAAFRDTHRTLLDDSFNAATLDPEQWLVNDGGAHLSLTGAGLTVSGGNGIDGATTLLAREPIEIAGALVAELASVTFGAGSAGTLAAFYAGPPLTAACLAGFRVTQSSATTTVQPLVQGNAVGTVFTPTAGHTYTLRVRLFCTEQHRLPTQYSSLVDGVVQTFGSAAPISAAVHAVFEIRDEGLASNTPATVLYDTAAAGAPIAAAPATCTFAAVNSPNLIGSITSVLLTRPSSLNVQSIGSTGPFTRLLGSAGEGADCTATFSTHTTITFFDGRIPAPAEQILITYRTSARSVARLMDAASVAAEVASGAPGSARWQGQVLAPIARTSQDCEAAAQAILAFSTSRSGALAGTYTTLNPTADIQPGDLLRLTSNGVTTALLVRGVELEDRHSAPETVRYKINFANSWATEFADGLGLQLSETVAADALLPSTASNGPPATLANLQALTLTAVTTTTLSLDTGTAPPAGGGFEVRRRDNAFGFGVDPVDLVLRSPVRAFSIPRAAQLERFYIRTYDASTPPLYSRWSSALFVNAPV